jgi:hypothetical protein
MSGALSQTSFGGSSLNSMSSGMNLRDNSYIT